MQNIDLSSIAKKRFKINDNEDAILELNTSDLNVLVRYEEGYSKLVDIMSKVTASKEGYTSADYAKFLSQVDKEMREWVDYIFDSNVSDMCAPFGNMYDPINGKFRFEYIVESLAELYDKELSTETKKMTKRIKAHTAKYEIE